MPPSLIEFRIEKSIEAKSVNVPSLLMSTSANTEGVFVTEVSGVSVHSQIMQYSVMQLSSIICLFQEGSTRFSGCALYP